MNVADDCKAIFTSAGVQLRNDVPLNETNDLSYRLIDRGTPYSALTVAHQTTSWASSTSGWLSTATVALSSSTWTTTGE